MLVDPPFEQPDEFSRLAHGIENAWRRWASGTLYPRKDPRAVRAFTHALVASPIRKVLRVELDLNADGTELGAAGPIIVNPPWRLASELSLLLPAFARLFARGPGGAHRLDWLRGEV